MHTHRVHTLQLHRDARTKITLTRSAHTDSTHAQCAHTAHTHSHTQRHIRVCTECTHTQCTQGPQCKYTAHTCTGHTKCTAHIKCTHTQPVHTLHTQCTHTQPQKDAVHTHPQPQRRTHTAHTQCTDTLLTLHRLQTCTNTVRTHTATVCTECNSHTHRVSVPHTPTVSLGCAEGRSLLSLLSPQCVRVALPLRSLWLLLSGPGKGCVGWDSQECSSGCRNPSPACWLTFPDHSSQCTKREWELALESPAPLRRKLRFEGEPGGIPKG